MFLILQHIGLFIHSLETHNTVFKIYEFIQSIKHILIKPITRRKTCQKKNISINLHFRELSTRRIIYATNCPCDELFERRTKAHCLTKIEFFQKINEFSLVTDEEWLREIHQNFTHNKLNISQMFQSDTTNHWTRPRLYIPNRVIPFAKSLMFPFQIHNFFTEDNDAIRKKVSHNI